MAVIWDYFTKEMGFLLSPLHLPDLELVSKGGPQRLTSLGGHTLVYSPEHLPSRMIHFN